MNTTSFRLTFGVELEFIVRFNPETYRDRLLAAEETLWPRAQSPMLRHKCRAHWGWLQNPSNTQIRKLRELLRKQRVWVLKNPKVSVAKILVNILQEEIPTQQTEEEITGCKDKEVFTSRHVTHLIETDFGRKPKWTTSTPSVAVPSPTARSPVVYSKLPSTNRLYLHSSRHPLD